MSEQEIIDLVDQFRASTSEKECFEFKQTQVQPNIRLGEYFSALANSAALAHQPFGYLVLGVHDKTHKVTGTTFDYRTEKIKGNEDLWFGTMRRMRPPTTVTVFEAQHPDGRVVVFRVAAASGEPVAYGGVEWVRVNESNTHLTGYPDKRRALWNLQTDWSAQILPGATIDDLDPAAIAKALEQYTEKNKGKPKKLAEIENWDTETFLNKAVVTIKGQVTNAAILLLGKEESVALISPAIAQISWFLNSEGNDPRGHEHYGPPFILNVDEVLGQIRNLTIRELPGGTLFPKEIQQYEDYVIREALHNAIAHQDYAKHARIRVIESPSRLVITNRGRFIPKSVEDVIERDAPPDLYRNPFLVRAMVNLNMIETEGGGILRMYRSQAERFMPLPSYNISDPEHVVVAIPGAILDKEYTRLLMRRNDLTLRQVFLLDKVQKGEQISKEDHKRLKALGLVEGRYPNLIVASAIAKETGKKARHIKQRGLDNQFYREMVVQLVREHQPVTRQDIDALLWTKLPDALDDGQKRNRIHNILKALTYGGHIENRGSRRYSQWYLGTQELPKEGAPVTKDSAS
jgi:ATP-dependent DNA helicase RecG